MGSVRLRRRNAAAFAFGLPLAVLRFVFVNARKFHLRDAGYHRAPNP